MPVKKKAQSKAHSKAKTMRKGRSATTVDSSAAVDHRKTTLPSSANPIAPKSPKGPTSPVQIKYPARDRRHNPEGRRGRYAEKTPPGTRTKMLRIIYDRKAEMARKRQQALIGKLIMAIVLGASLYYGMQHAADFARTSVGSAVEWMDLRGWWHNVAGEKPATYRKYTGKTYRNSG